MGDRQAAHKKQRKYSFLIESRQTTFYTCIIVTDMEGNIRMYRMPEIDRTRGEGNISFMVLTMTQGQSFYPDVALHISNNIQLITP